MKNLRLNFPVRLQLTNMLGTVTGNLSKMAALQHIWLAVKFSDEELQVMKITDRGNGVCSYEAPYVEWGQIDIQIEDSYATTLQQEMESHQGFRVTDIEWVDDLKRQLSAPSVRKEVPDGKISIYHNGSDRDQRPNSKERYGSA